MAEANVGDIGIPQGDLAEQADMKAIIGGLDLGFTTFMSTFYDSMAQGVQNSRASQRRTNEAADAVHGLMLNDFRTQAAAQNGTLTGANGARQDLMSTQETEQALANQIQNRVAEEMARFEAVLANQRQEIAASLSTQQNQLANAIVTLAAAIAEVRVLLEVPKPAGP